MSSLSGDTPSTAYRRRCEPSRTLQQFALDLPNGVLRDLLDGRPGLLRRTISDRLDAAGLLLLRGVADLPEALWPEILIKVCRAIGTPMRQANDDESAVRQVRYRSGVSDNSARYSESRLGGSFHTDGVPLPGNPPEVLALLCVRQAREGGELVFIESDELVKQAATILPHTVDILAREFHFELRGSKARNSSTVRQILTRQGKRWQLVYLRDYIESGHLLPGRRALMDDERFAFDLIDSLADAESRHIEERLKPGDLVIADNLRFLHGRHAFQDYDALGLDGGRLMLRCWVRRTFDESLHRF